MSLQMYIDDLCREDLTAGYLEKVWDHHNLQSKSPLIDPLTKVLHLQIGKSEGGTLAPAITAKICTVFRNKVIRNKVGTIEPMLETISVGGEDVTYDPPTGIIFEDIEHKGKTLNVATGVAVEGKRYPLHLKHLNICTSKGWYFKSDSPAYDSPFRI